MSKKHRRQLFNQGGHQPVSSAFSHEVEYRIIKFDLIKVFILNLIYLGAILALYYTNQKSHYLENWFAHLLHF